MSPTARSLEKLRELGYEPGVVEMTVRGKGIVFKRDLFGFVDIVGISQPAPYAVMRHEYSKRHLLFIQTTSGSGGNHAARRAKMLASPNLPKLLATGARVELWSWRKAGPRGKRKTWQLRTEALTFADLATEAV